MAKKRTTRKKTPAKGDTDKARREAIKEIDARLNGDATAAQPCAAARGKTASKKASSKEAASKKAPVKKSPKPSRMSGLDAAAQVLAEAGKPLNCLDIMEAIIKKQLWATTGKTPHATLSAAMSREIAKKGTDSRFVKAGRGLFAING